MKRIGLIVLLCFALSLLKAQDPHFSQPAAIPSWFSPALSMPGYSGNYFSAALRDQWRSVPVPFTSVAFTAGGDILLEQNRFIWEGQFLYDEAGDARMRWLKLKGTIAYELELTPDISISAGVGLAGFQRAFDPQNLTFNEQYDGDVFQANRPNMENFSRMNRIGINISAGLGGNIQLSENLDFSLRYGLHNANQPNVAFLDETSVNIPIRHALLAKTAIKINPKSSLSIYHLLHSQGPGWYNFRENLSSLEFAYILKRTMIQEIALKGGLGYRYGDALIPMAGMQYNHWQFSLSYDINTSPFVSATGSRGGIEFHISRFIHRKPQYVLPPACPAL